MIKSTVVKTTLFIWCCTCIILQANTTESYLTPRLRLTAGYDANRMRTADDQQGSSFLETAPGLGFVMFVGDNLQWNIDAEYAPRLFFGGAKGDQSTLQAGTGVSLQQNALTYELWGGGGSYQDSEIPDDDISWFYITPSVGWAYQSGRQLYLRLTYSPSDYKSRLTYDDEAETAEFFGMSCGWYTALGQNADMWIEVFFENFSANEPVDEYRTFGAATGIGRWISPVGRLDFAARWGNQHYPNEMEGITERDANPIRVSTQYTHRFYDWVSLELLARWERLPTSDVTDEYEQWLVSSCLTFSWDISLSTKRYNE